MNVQEIIQKLTDRELEILILVSDGWSNPDIAKKLFIATNTVLTHLANLKEKTQTRNRVQLANFYHAHIKKSQT